MNKHNSKLVIVSLLSVLIFGCVTNNIANTKAKTITAKSINCLVPSGWSKSSHVIGNSKVLFVEGPHSAIVVVEEQKNKLSLDAFAHNNFNTVVLESFPETKISRRFHDIKSVVGGKNRSGIREIYSAMTSVGNIKHIREYYSYRSSGVSWMITTQVAQDKAREMKKDMNRILKSLGR